MELSIQPPRYAKAYVELMTFISDLGVTIDENRVLDAIMEDCVIMHSVPRRSKKDDKNAREV